MTPACRERGDDLKGLQPSDQESALRELGEAYADRNLVLVAGPGISTAAGLPSWKQVVDHVAAGARARSVDDASVGEILDLANSRRLVDALSAAKAALGGTEFSILIERLLDDRGRAVPEVAAAIAALAPRMHALLTTNIDHLLERAFCGSWPVLFRATGNIAQRRGFILKLHGTLLDRETWVVTRAEYDRAMYADPRLQTAFEALFHARTLLFVGYGLDDDNSEHILRRVRALAGDQPPRHFACVPRMPWRLIGAPRTGIGGGALDRVQQPGRTAYRGRKRSSAHSGQSLAPGPLAEEGWQARIVVARP